MRKRRHWKRYWIYRSKDKEYLLSVKQRLLEILAEPEADAANGHIALIKSSLDILGESLLERTDKENRKEDVTGMI